MGKVTKVVTRAMVLNAVVRDIASGRPDSENLALAFFDESIRLGWAAEKLMDRWMGRSGRKMYRDFVKTGHKLFGAESITLSVEE
jgi:hypothetical protein